MAARAKSKAKSAKAKSAKAKSAKAKSAKAKSVRVASAPLKRAGRGSGPERGLLARLEEGVVDLRRGLCV